MTTLREAAQMALDALEHGLPIIEDFGTKEQLQLQHKAIAALYEALRAALAAKEPEPLPAKSKGALSHEENKQHNKKILEKFYEDNAHFTIS